MAKCTITFEDKPNGGVAIHATPTGTEMAAAVALGHSDSTAYCFALTAMKVIHALDNQKHLDSLIKTLQQMRDRQRSESSLIRMPDFRL